MEHESDPQEGILLGLVAAATAWGPPPAQEDIIFPFDYVSMVRTGSRDEAEPCRTGYAHFFEHMMLRGTENYPMYDDVTASMGAARNAFTSNDMTVY